MVADRLKSLHRLLSGEVQNSDFETNEVRPRLERTQRELPALSLALEEAAPSLVDQHARVGRIVTRLLGRWQDLRITNSELAFLLRVVTYGWVRPKEMAAEMGVSRRYVLQVGKQLAEKGLVRHVRYKGYDAAPLLDRLEVR